MDEGRRGGESRKRPGLGDNGNSGRRKRTSSRHDDASSSIETLFRILCPMRKIGSVLGRGGDIVNALREETGAKIRVAEVIPGAEERVVIVFNYTGDVCREGAQKEEMRPHCPAQHALIKVHERIVADELDAATGMNTGREEVEVVARVLVPTNQVGCLLGKGGTIIQQLRSETRANIRIMPSGHLPPCAMHSDELVQISGTPSLVKIALYEISTRLHLHLHKEIPELDDLVHASTRDPYDPAAPLPLGGSSWPSFHRKGHSPMRSGPPVPWYDRSRHEPPEYISRSRMEVPEEFSLKFICQSGKIGGIIGKGGSTVRQVEQETRSHINVKDGKQDSGESIVIISSMEVLSDLISPTIEALLILHSKLSSISDNGLMTTRLLVPSNKVGCILGEGGRVIMEMRRRTRADIRIFSKEDKPKIASADEELVQVAGDPLISRGAVVEIASRLRERTLRAPDRDVAVPYYGSHPEDIFPPRERNPVPSRRPGIDSSTSPRRYAPPEYFPKRDFALSRSPVAVRPPPQRYDLVDHMRSRDYLLHDSATVVSVDRMPRGERPFISTHRDPYYSYGLPATEYGSAGKSSLGALRSRDSGGYDYFKDSRQMHDALSYAEPASGTRYPVMSSSGEYRIPLGRVDAIIGPGGSNLSEIRQITGAKVQVNEPRDGSSECVVEIHGTPEQVKSVQNLLHSFSTKARPPQASWPYKSSAWI